MIKLTLLQYFLISSPEPNLETVSLRKVQGGIAAAVKFSGRPTEDVVRQKEEELRSALIESGLKPVRGCVLARYNDPERTLSFILVPSFFPFNYKEHW